MRKTAALVIMALTATVPAFAAEECTRCHEKVMEGKYVHGPVAVRHCLTCHAPTGRTHPGTGSMLYVRTKGELCTYCHDAKFVRKGVHDARTDNCPSCHDPHSSANAYFLREGSARAAAAGR